VLLLNGTGKGGKKFKKKATGTKKGYGKWERKTGIRIPGSCRVSVSDFVGICIFEIYDESVWRKRIGRKLGTKKKGNLGILVMIMVTRTTRGNFYYEFHARGRRKKKDEKGGKCLEKFVELKEIKWIPRQGKKNE